MPFATLNGDISCVLFDLDGTLVDSRRDIATALDEALAIHGHPPLGVDVASSLVGDGVRRLVERAIEAVGGDAAETDALVTTYMARYRVRHLDTTELYPGVASTLEDLHAGGVSCAVVTNKPREFSVSLLEHLGVGRFFRAVLGGDSLPSRKPSPEPLLAAIAACNATPAAGVMVGDGETDIRAGRAAGLRTVAVTYGFRPADSLALLEPDVMIDAMTELVPALWPRSR